MSSPKVCFIMTDAIAFKMLCRGQLEYIRDNSNLDVTLVCGGEEKELNILSSRKVGKVFDAKLVRQPSMLNDLISLWKLTKFFATNRFDLIIYSTPKAMLLGSIATFITFHRNTIAIVRGRAYENFSGKKRKFYQLLDKITLKLSNQILFISKSLMDVYLKENLTDLKKSHIIGSGSSNGVNINKFTPNIANTENELNSNKPFSIIIAGRVCPDKGIYDLKEVVSKVQNPNIQFRLVGPIEGKDTEQFLSNLISDYPNISHIPYTDNIEDYFKTANLHLFLTHREGFGNVAIEAASSNIPTFAYNVVGVKDSVKNNVSGQTFEYKDTSSIAKAIDEAANQKKFSDNYPNARQWVTQNFEQSMVWRKYLEFYLKCIQKP